MTRKLRSTIAFQRISKEPRISFCYPIYSLSKSQDASQRQLRHRWYATTKKFCFYYTFLKAAICPKTTYRCWQSQRMVPNDMHSTCCVLHTSAVLQLVIKTLLLPMWQQRTRKNLFHNIEQYPYSLCSSKTRCCLMLVFFSLCQCLVWYRSGLRCRHVSRYLVYCFVCLRKILVQTQRRYSIPSPL